MSWIRLQTYNAFTTCPQRLQLDVCFGVNEWSIDWFIWYRRYKIHEVQIKQSDKMANVNQ